MKKGYFHSVGVLQYDPFRGPMKHRTDWWCVLNVDKEITRYYRWWLSYHCHIHLFPPAWNAHVSVVRGERPISNFVNNWKYRDGEKVDFWYSHTNIQSDRSQRSDERAKNAVGGEYYFIDVICPTLDDIRKSLGLKVGYKYHLTVGRSYEYEAKRPKRG